MSKVHLPLVFFVLNYLIFIVLSSRLWILNLNIFSPKNVSLKAIRKMLIFSLPIFAVNGIQVLSNFTFNLIVFKNISSRTLSIIERPKYYVELFHSSAGLAISKVLFPSLTVEKNPSRYIRAESVTNYVVLSVVYWPIAILFGFLGMTLVDVVFSEEWNEIKKLLFLLFSISGYTFGIIYAQVLYKVHNFNREYLAFDLARKILFILIIYISTRFYAEYFTWIFLASSFVLACANHIFLDFCSNWMLERKQYVKLFFSALISVLAVCLIYLEVYTLFTIGCYLTLYILLFYKSYSKIFSWF